LPYNYGKDTAANKPVANVEASDFFDYVIAGLGLTPEAGKTYQIQLSGEESIPVTVNGTVESGNPEENLMVIINNIGARSYVFQSNLQDEYFQFLSSKGDEARIAIEAEQVQMDLLEGILDAM
jgi:hypothetical protein